MIDLFKFSMYTGAANVASGESRSWMSALRTWYRCFSTNSISILSTNKSIAGYHLGYLLQDLANNKDVALNTISELFRLYDEGALKPQVDTIFPFSKIGEAMQRMHNRQNVGKVLLRPDQDNSDSANTEAAQELEEKSE